MLTVPELGDRKWPEDHRTLLHKCREELLNPEFIAYPHGNRNTRQRGCDGPMCRKAARDYGRQLQRRIHDAQSERISSIRKHDEFLDAFIQFATEAHRKSGLTPPKRRKLKDTRVHRSEHLIPMHVVRMLHKRRARLAS